MTFDMMKNMRKLVLILSFVFCLTAAQAKDYLNYDLPVRPDTLKILAIGNSFSDDAMMYLPAMLQSSGVHNVVLGRLYIGSCSLQRHCEEYRNGGSNYVFWKSEHNEWVEMDSSASLLDGLQNEDWDIITLQQVSGLSGDYRSYVPYLGELISIVRENSLNPRASIVWHETWAYANNSSHPDFVNYERNQTKMFKQIDACVHAIMSVYDFRKVIPTGRLIQVVRKSTFNTENDLTRDGYHLDYRLGRYTAALCWYESLIVPTIGKKLKTQNLPALIGQEYSKNELWAIGKFAQKAAKMSKPEAFLSGKTIY